MPGRLQFDAQHAAAGPGEAIMHRFRYASCRRHVHQHIQPGPAGYIRRNAHASAADDMSGISVLDGGERADHGSRIAGGDHQDGVGLTADVRHDPAEPIAGVDHHRVGRQVLTVKSFEQLPSRGSRTADLVPASLPDNEIDPAWSRAVASLQVCRPARTSASVYRSSMPQITAASPPRGSASINSVRWPLCAKAAARFSATVVVPTPPLPPATTSNVGRSRARGDCTRLAMRGQSSQIVSLVGHEEGVRGQGSGVRDQGSGIRQEGLTVHCPLKPLAVSQGPQFFRIQFASDCQNHPRQPVGVGNLDVVGDILPVGQVTQRQAAGTQHRQHVARPADFIELG